MPLQGLPTVGATDVKPPDISTPFELQAGANQNALTTARILGEQYQNQIRARDLEAENVLRRASSMSDSFNPDGSVSNALLLRVGQSGNMKAYNALVTTASAVEQKKALAAQEKARAEKDQAEIYSKYGQVIDEAMGKVRRLDDQYTAEKMDPKDKGQLLTATWQKQLDEWGRTAEVAPSVLARAPKAYDASTFSSMSNSYQKWLLDNQKADRGTPLMQELDDAGVPRGSERRKAIILGDIYKRHTPTPIQVATTTGAGGVPVAGWESMRDDDGRFLYRRHTGTGMVQRQNEDGSWTTITDVHLLKGFRKLTAANPISGDVPGGVGSVSLIDPDSGKQYVKNRNGKAFEFDDEGNPHEINPNDVPKNAVKPGGSAATRDVVTIDQRRIDKLATEHNISKYALGAKTAADIEQRLTDPKSGFLSVTPANVRTLVEQGKQMMSGYRPWGGGKYQEEQIGRMNSLLDRLAKFTETIGTGEIPLAKDRMLEFSREIGRLYNDQNTALLRNELNIAQGTQRKGGSAAKLTMRGDINAAIKSGNAYKQNIDGTDYLVFAKKGQPFTKDDAYPLPSE